MNRAMSVLAATWCGLHSACAVHDPPEPSETGEATVYLSEAPDDANCLRILVTGSRTVERRFDLTPGQRSVFSLGGLPLGEDTFAATAYALTCGAVEQTSAATWLGDPVTATVSAGVAANVTLVMRRNAGTARVTLDFSEEEFDAGAADADAGTPDAEADAQTDGQVDATLPPVIYRDISGYGDYQAGWQFFFWYGGQPSVVSTNLGSEHRPWLTWCLPDGTNCLSSAIALAPHSGLDPVAVTQPATGEVIVVATNGANEFKLVAYGCYPGTTDNLPCSTADISAGRPGQSGYSPSLVLDANHSKLLVVTNDQSNQNRPALFRCNFDRTGCSYTDISAGAPDNTGLLPAAVVDDQNQKLLVVTMDAWNLGHFLLFRCDLDGSACTHSEIAASWPIEVTRPRAVIDREGGKLLVVFQDPSIGDQIAMFRCDLDGTACTYSNMSAGQPPGSGLAPTIAIDPRHHKLLVVTENRANDHRLALFRCNLDGSECMYRDISALQGANSGVLPSAAVQFDTLAVIAVDAPRGNKLGLFLVTLW